MIGFDVKATFQRIMVETLIILMIIYIGTLVFLFILRWVHPHLKNYIVKHRNIKANKLLKQGCESQSINNSDDGKAVECKDKFSSNFMDENYSNLLDSLKTFVGLEACQIYPEVWDECGSYACSLNNMVVGIEETVNLRRILRHTGKKNSYSSGTQTNLSIHPKRKVQCILPEPNLSQAFSDISITSSTLSDQFESASSGSSENNEPDCDCMAEFSKLDCADSLRHNETEDDVIKTKIDSIELCPNIQRTRNINNIAYAESLLSKECGRQVSLENLILESAISEFGKELEPIQDQIRVLKACLSDLDSVISSDMSSSLTSTVEVSEWSSQIVSSTCSSNLYGTISLPLSNNLNKSGASVEGKPKLNLSATKAPILSSTENNFFSNTNCDKFQTLDRHCNTEPKKCKKRSPLAEMYVKLSQCSSQPNYVTNTKNFNLVHSKNNKPFTCRIDLNLNIGAVSSYQEIKTPKIFPILSEPEDLLYKALDMEKCSRPAKFPLAISS